ncbi:MAG TPA: DUF6350 family protein [Micromonosporaceae bacterium]|nr:DUF6350 family protein [Micromonosporaceae bacterium]
MAASPDEQRRPASAAPRGAVRPRGELHRPTRPARAPLLVAAAVATLWAALLSALPVAGAVGLAQLAEDPSIRVGDITRYGLAAWLLSHGVPLRTAVGTLGLAPLAVAALAVWRVVRAGVHVTRAIGARHSRSPRIAARAALAVGSGYGLLGAVVAAVIGGPSLHVSPVRAGLVLGAFGSVAAGAGALWATGAWVPLARRLPAVVRNGLRTGAVAALLVLAAGAALAGTAVAVGGGDAGETLASYRTGVAGQAGLTLVCLAYAPNVAAWGASYLVGPGFALGVDSMVRTSEVSVGALPALPLVAALPSGPTGGAGAVLLGTPLLAGLAAGALLARERLRAIRLAGGRREAIRRVSGGRQAGGPSGTGGSSRAGGLWQRGGSGQVGRWWQAGGSGQAGGGSGPADGGSWQALLGGAGLAGPVAGVLLGLAAQASGGPLGAGRLAVVGPVGWQVALISSGVVAAGAVLGAAAARTLLRS